jgi:hypothetical protein
MARTALLAGSLAGIMLCTGCNVLRIISITNDISGAIVNTTILAGTLGLAANISSIITYIQNLLGGI